MKNATTAEQEFDRIVAAVGALLAALFVLNRMVPATTLLLLFVGFALIFLFFVLLLVYSAALVDVVRNGAAEGTESKTVETATSMVKLLGALVLLCAACWGWGVFGLGRLVEDPSFEEAFLIPALLLGGSGLLLLQRWASVLVCGIGWWWLTQDAGGRAASPISLIVLLLTASVVVSWRHLKNAP